MDLQKKLETYLEHNLNVLMIGSHGIGKTTMAKAAAKNLGLKLSYYSTSTLDPWTDIVGVPKPDDEEDSLKFYRPSKIKDAEFLFFDELNRAHPRVLNAVLEIIQFRTVNDEPLPNLKCVWAAINPPDGNYQVEELDPALVDRFHVFVKLSAVFNRDYMTTKMNESTADCLHAWWNEDLNKAQRAVVTPRRLEYMGILIDSGIDFRDAIPQGNYMIPHQELAKKIAIAQNQLEEISLTEEFLLKDPKSAEAIVLNDKQNIIKVAELMSNFSAPQLFNCRDILELLPKELLNKLIGIKFEKFRSMIKEQFDKEAVPLAQYPKIAEVGRFNEFE